VLIMYYQAKLFSCTLALRLRRKVRTTPTIAPKKINFVNKLSPGLSVEVESVSLSPPSGCFSGCFGSSFEVTSTSSPSTAGRADPMSSF